MHEAYVVFPPATISVHIESITSDGELQHAFTSSFIFLLSMTQTQITGLFLGRVKGTCSCIQWISIHRTVEWN